MEKSRNLTFFELCRLCLDAHGTVDVLETENLNQDVFLVTTVKICTKDKLPQKICHKCQDVVESASKLRKLALNNDSNLRVLFGDETCGEEIDELNKIKEHIAKNFNERQLKKNGHRTKKNKSKNYKKKHRNKRPVEENTSSSSPIKISHISVRKDIFRETIKETLPEKNTSENISRSVTDSNKKRRRSSMDNDVEHVCSECNKTFDLWKKLYHHQRSHVKNFVCPIAACGKRFSSKGDLQKHKRTHTGEKPYQCDVCEKCFSQNVTLKVHQETVHGLWGIQ